MGRAAEERFEAFFSDPVYLLYKNHLYNFLLRRQVIRSRLRGAVRGRVVEVGCGISPMLPVGRPAIQTDVSWRALRNLKTFRDPVKKGLFVVCEATRLSFGRDSMEGVICSEVLEHIERDGQVLEEIQRILVPGGELLLTCPARPELFGFDDQFVGHARRYDLRDLLGRLEGKGFQDFETSPVLGPLEKSVMEKVTRFFAWLRARDKGATSEGKGIRLLAWLFFPVYLVANYLLALFVYAEVRNLPAEKAVTILIRCRKRA